MKYLPQNGVLCPLRYALPAQSQFSSRYSAHLYPMKMTGIAASTAITGCTLYGLSPYSVPATVIGAKSTRLNKNPRLARYCIGVSVVIHQWIYVPLVYALGFAVHTDLILGRVYDPFVRPTRKTHFSARSANAFSTVCLHAVHAYRFK